MTKDSQPSFSYEGSPSKLYSMGARSSDGFFDQHRVELAQHTSEGARLVRLNSIDGPVVFYKLEGAPRNEKHPFAELARDRTDIKRR